MYKGVTVETVHFAHICIIPAKSGETIDLCDEIDEHVKEILAEYYSENQCDEDHVRIDPEFRCNALTEVGLCGSSLDGVQSVAVGLAKWVENHPNLKLIG